MRPRLPSVLVPPRARERALRVALLLAFAWLAGRFWHPYHGFTAFLQFDREVAARMVPSLRDTPIFVYDEPGSYDGAYYAQIATSPGLADPALRPAIDDAGYRARRILLSAVAWALGRGDPLSAARAYAALNLALWFALAAALWRLFPTGDRRATAAWTTLLFGAGVLFSVRLALTDLAALLLLALAGHAAERGRHAAVALVGVAGLARETALLGVVLLAGEGREALRRPLRLLLLGGAALLPLGLWLAWVGHVYGGSGAGLRNFAWPLAGWLARWTDLARGVETTGNPRLVFTSLLEHVALTVQAAYLLRRPRRDCRWWRLGLASVLLMLVLGHAVWDGFPNAATRVLLPLTLAFNLRAVRDRARWAWLLLGNLSVLAGVTAFWTPPGRPHELPAHSTWESRHLLATDARWSVAEWHADRRWAWCGGDGGLEFRTWPHRARLRLQLELRGVTPREVEVWHAGSRVWRGPVGDRPQWIELPELPAERGRIVLELRSPAAPRAEGADATARRISFACFGARLVD